MLRFVVREESARVSSRREVLALDADALEVRDPSPDQLDLLIDDEQQTIVRECLSALGEDYRRVLTLRAKGLKYTEIASRLGVSENTVATWVRRGTSVVARQVRERMDHRPRARNGPRASEMTKVPMPDVPSRQLDRYFAGELSAPEQRDLAQAALDDPELFDALTAAAVVKATVLRDGAPKPAEVRRAAPTHSASDA